MKLLNIIICTFTTALSFAAEVSTECRAMIEIRENMSKEAKPRSETGTRSKVSIQ